MKYEDALPYVSFSVGSDGNVKPDGYKPIPEAVLVGWQCGFEPLFVAVEGHRGVRLDEGDAEEMAREALEARDWFAGRENKDSDYMLYPEAIKQGQGNAGSSDAVNFHWQAKREFEFREWDRIDSALREIKKRPGMEDVDLKAEMFDDPKEPFGVQMGHLIIGGVDMNGNNLLLSSDGDIGGECAVRAESAALVREVFEAVKEAAPGIFTYSPSHGIDRIAPDNFRLSLKKLQEVLPEAHAQIDPTGEAVATLPESSVVIYLADGGNATHWAMGDSLESARTWGKLVPSVDGEGLTTALAEQEGNIGKLPSMEGVERVSPGVYRLTIKRLHEALPAVHVQIDPFFHATEANPDTGMVLYVDKGDLISHWAVGEARTAITNWQKFDEAIAVGSIRDEAAAQVVDPNKVFIVNLCRQLEDDPETGVEPEVGVAIINASIASSMEAARTFIREDPLDAKQMWAGLSLWYWTVEQVAIDAKIDPFRVGERDIYHFTRRGTPLPLTQNIGEFSSAEERSLARAAGGADAMYDFTYRQARDFTDEEWAKIAEALPRLASTTGWITADAEALHLTGVCDNGGGITIGRRTLEPGLPHEGTATANAGKSPLLKYVLDEVAMLAPEAFSFERSLQSPEIDTPAPARRGRGR